MIKEQLTSGGDVGKETAPLVLATDQCCPAGALCHLRESTASREDMQYAPIS